MERLQSNFWVYFNLLFNFSLGNVLGFLYSILEEKKQKMKALIVIEVNSQWLHVPVVSGRGNCISGKFSLFIFVLRICINGTFEVEINEDESWTTLCRPTVKWTVCWFIFDDVKLSIVWQQANTGSFWFLISVKQRGNLFFRYQLHQLFHFLCRPPQQLRSLSCSLLRHRFQ